MKKALLIIDAQEDFIGEQRNKQRFDFEDIDKLINNINEKIIFFERNEDIVVYIVNALPNNFFYRKFFRYTLVGTRGAKLDKRITIISQNYFEKQFGSAFKNNNLVNFIEKNEISEIEMVGVDINGCIFKTAKSAVKIGLNVTISSDSIGIINNERYLKISNKLKSIGVAYI
ncbi:isochorismatase family protein [Clostridium beijerinckii]|uniref:isochorismatase family protein n=1 Tax=Clostridium beijerinckii TaxID=1520 RepID=UPI00047CCE0E|nr:isochorismatase family protein [Clostridium beijerinckii]